MKIHRLSANRATPDKGNCKKNLIFQIFIFNITVVSEEENIVEY